MSAPAPARERSVSLVSAFLNFVSDESLEALEPHLDTHWHPEIEWYPAIVTFGKKSYRGLDEYRDYLRQAKEVEGAHLDVREVRPIGADSVLALTYVNYVGTGEHAPLHSEYALLIQIEDEMNRTIRAFLSFAEAERAAADA